MHVQMFHISSVRGGRMFLVSLLSRCQNVVKKLQVILRIKTICRLNFHVAQKFDEVECTLPSVSCLRLIKPLHHLAFSIFVQSLLIHYASYYIPSPIKKKQKLNLLFARKQLY